jgi:hypothetical protein
MRYVFKEDQLDAFVRKIHELEDQETSGDTEFYSLIKPHGDLVILVGEPLEEVYREAIRS